jgi:hypothetical protein
MAVACGGVEFLEELRGCPAFIGDWLTRSCCTGESEGIRISDSDWGEHIQSDIGGAWVLDTDSKGLSRDTKRLTCC